MKIKDIIAEAKMDLGLRRAMENKGYKFLGKGQDQDVYLSPYDGTIIKIFGTDLDSNAGNYSKGQRSVIDFANYCMANSSNPFLPTFGGVERFEFKGKFYLQISTERLFEPTGKFPKGMFEILELVSDRVYYDSSVEKILRWLDTRLEGGYNTDDVAQTILYLGGMDNFKLLIKTIADLAKISNKKNYRFDLHSGNFMMASDGHIVINDPFFTGTWRN